MPVAAIAVRNVSKSFPGVQALRDVSLDVQAGEVHGLVGANGAGKSTLIRILSGAHEADSGTILINGRPIVTDQARQLRASGVAAIYQELNIVPEMSALSNVFLGASLRRGPLIDRRAMRARFADLAARTGAGFAADTKAATLSVANKQLIEIMRAVQARHSVLIMDEPTAPLGPAERSRLYSLIGRLKAEGTAIIFISHDLDEVLRLCDRVSVMRDGRLVQSTSAEAWSKQTLVAAMLGNIPIPPVRDRSRHGTKELLRVDNLSAGGWVSGVSFTLHEGEILGVAGLVGAGRTEVLGAIAGGDTLAEGRFAFAGTDTALPHSIRDAVGRGIALAPEDRKTQGLVLSRDATSNLTLAGLAAVARGPFLNRHLRAHIARRLAQSVGFDPARLGVEARSLSGGNQQKLVLGKWLHRQPRVLLLDEPTRGIDVGAKQEIFATIRALADRGMGVILVSSDLEEVVEHADSILVMARGRQIGLLDYREASVARILNLIFAVEGLPRVSEVDQRVAMLPAASLAGLASPTLRQRLPAIIRVWGIIGTFVLLLAVVTAGNPAFLSSHNIFNMLSQWSPAGIMAVGMTYVILTGGFDLSLASGYSLCAVVAAYVGQSQSPGLAILAAMIVGLLYGIANGVLVAVVRINPFITTVGTGFILNGIVLVMTQNAAFLVDDPAFGILGAGRWHGVPYSGMLLIAFMIVFALVLSRTTYGEAIYAVGGNYEASRLSGLRVRTIVASSYVLLGGCVGIAGSITASQLSSAQANIDPLIIFDVLTIVVVGGTSLAGGSGAMWRTAVGLGIIATISNGFVLLDISPYYQDVIKGAIIVGALALDNGLLRLVRRRG